MGNSDNKQIERGIGVRNMTIHTKPTDEMAMEVLQITHSGKERY